MKHMAFFAALFTATTLFAADPATVKLPFKSDFTKKHAAVSHNNKKVEATVSSGSRYVFLHMILPKSGNGAVVTIEYKGAPESRFGVIHYAYKLSPKKTYQPLKTLAWNCKVTGEYTTLKLNIAPEAMTDFSRLLFYNCTRKPEVTIRSVKIEEAKGALPFKIR